MPDAILLKKYANRRLYDTDRSCYVTLEDVAGMIKAGYAVKAEDAKTGEDVTAFILTQIVLEQARQKNILLPAPLLHMVIRYGDNLLVEFLDNYLQQTFQNYVVYKSRMDEQFKRWLDFGMNLSGMTRNPDAIPGLFSVFPPNRKGKQGDDGDEQ